LLLDHHALPGLLEPICASPVVRIFVDQVGCHLQEQRPQQGERKEPQIEHVRIEGNDEELKALARDNAVAIGAGHSFILFLRDCYPINVLNAIKNIQEVCTIYCATANPAEVVIAESAQGRGIMGVIDGEKPKGVEGPEGLAWRTGLLRKFGYKKG
jgi:adenosine/AMP kinase